MVLVSVLCVVGIVAAIQGAFFVFRGAVITLSCGALLYSILALLGRLPVRNFRATKLTFDENGWRATGHEGLLADEPWADFGGYRFIQESGYQYLEMLDAAGAVNSRVLLGSSVYEFQQFPSLIEELDLRLSANAVREHWPATRGNVLQSLARSTTLSIALILGVTGCGAWLLTAVSGWDLNTWLATGVLVIGATMLVWVSLRHARWVRLQALARDQIANLRWSTQEVRPLRARSFGDLLSLAAPFPLLSFGALVFVASPFVGLFMLFLGFSGLENYRNLRCRGRHVFVSNDEIVVQTKDRTFYFDPAECSVCCQPERMFLAPQNLLISDAKQSVEVINDSFGDEFLLEILNRVISNAKVDTPVAKVVNPAFR
ncbi:MAG: hypothetical protein HONBIEJF_01122 [Fimbriimonadaceae bacterium]|nr:hypothetical protein [Fimbriimonadaceae bacterium]